MVCLPWPRPASPVDGALPLKGRGFLLPGGLVAGSPHVASQHWTLPRALWEGGAHHQTAVSSLPPPMR